MNKRIISALTVACLCGSAPPSAWSAASPTPPPDAGRRTPAAVPSPEPQERVPGEIVTQSVSGQINWTAGRALASGGGAPPAKGSPAQRRLMAERAALVDGYRNLAEILHGVHVSSETTVQDFVTQSDLIRTQVQGLVKGATITHKRLLSDGSVEVDVEVPLYGQEGLMGIFLEKILKPLHRARRGMQVASLPVPVWPGEGVAAAAASGVIIDGHGLGLEPAMSPAILAEDRRELYLGAIPVDKDIVINQGVVEYFGSLDQARRSPRAGNNPLVIRAQGAGGRLKADVILDGAAAQALQEADQGGRFLARAAVVIVL